MKNVKDGAWEQFEDLATWINKCLHKTAVITKNDKIRDKDTGRLRQVDLTIRLSDGPTEFLGIVEARERSRPVGVNYIEEIQQKRLKIGADGAFVISNKGFYQTAIKKADALGIRVFQLQEALQKDWTECIQQFQSITVQKVRSRNAVLSLWDDKTHDIFQPHNSILEQLHQQKGKQLQLFVNATHLPHKSFQDLSDHGHKELSRHTKLMVGEENAQIRRVLVNLTNLPEHEKIYILNEHEEFQLINYYLLEGEFWLEETQYPVKVSQYRNPEDGHVYAEVITPENLEELNVEFLVEHSRNKTEGSQVFVRHITKHENRKAT